MVKESFIAPTPLEAYQLAIDKYGSIENFRVVKASQYKNSENTLVAKIEIEVDSDSFTHSVGISEEEQLINELNSLKSKMNRMKEALATTPEIHEFKEPVVPSEQSQESKDAIAHVKELLKEKGLDKKWIDYMLDPFASTQIAEDETLLVSFILEELEEALLIDRNPLKNRVHLFVGATGVGKTTTIAKIIAHSIHKGVSPKEIGVINLDNIRAAANEQLGFYARRMGVEYYYAKTQESIEDILQILQDKTLIYIDSAGSAPMDLQKLINTVDFYQKSRAVIGTTQTNLVISAGTKYNDLKKIYEHFSFLKPTSTIVTKLDETQDIGNIVAFLLETKLPVSYLSVGQNVPQDLELASKEKILDYFIGDLKEQSSKD